MFAALIHVVTKEPNGIPGIYFMNTGAEIKYLIRAAIGRTAAIKAAGGIRIITFLYIGAVYGDCIWRIAVVLGLGLQEYGIDS